MSSAIDELKALGATCGDKRIALIEAGTRRSMWRKTLHIASGVLALLSAASITAVIAAFTDSMTVKVFSAVVAFVAGTITLVTSGLFDEKETAKIFEGAAKFLTLRDRAFLIASRRNVTDKQAYSAQEKLRGEYATCSREYDQFIGRMRNREHGWGRQGASNVAPAQP